MKKLICIALASIMATGCFGIEVETEVHLTDIENCILQLGEWTGSACKFEGEICLIKAQCKINSENCPCIQWGYE